MKKRTKRELRRPRRKLLLHLFLHQVPVLPKVQRLLLLQFLHLRRKNRENRKNELLKRSDQFSKLCFVLIEFKCS
ncbi:hypothetical protein RchiOBHm_Chr5g0063791 [Rosa chinensis]|uniref:Uncharacterized protein n=1 Tax=Rosa chinensis TaxID=74649 RepID=A0A2P6QIH3_ROSCH|nr:hypothetical protein RchiOBHm_Chr5g0063791 [Rosa chinensis]